MSGKLNVLVTGATRGVDTVFAMSTPFEGGEKKETREGINIVRAAATAGVKHLVYTSVAGADRASGIPHFDSKFEVEKEIRRSGVPFTIVAPVFFMENFLADWMAPAIAQGAIALACYNDSFVKTSADWLFSERRLYVDWIEERALS